MPGTQEYLPNYAEFLCYQAVSLKLWFLFRFRFLQSIQAKQWCLYLGGHAFHDALTVAVDPTKGFL